MKISNNRPSEDLDRQPRRRKVLGVLAGAGLLPLLPIACDTDASTTDEADPLDDDEDGETSGSTGGSFAGWASGGTASMVDKTSYPDPFSAALTSCAIVTGTTAGPCTTETEVQREDVSEGWSGLPVRLLLKVVDDSCMPLTGATVNVWHTNLEGSYSGQTPNNNMCLVDQSYALEHFFRGVRETDADGVVAFDTCFPGWYRGRAVHIHFQVTSGGQTYAVSQLFFPEDITEGIFASHEEYSGFGQPDTVFATDNIMSGIAQSAWQDHIFDVQQMSDGAMLASKVVAVA